MKPRFEKQRSMARDVFQDWWHRKKVGMQSLKDRADELYGIQEAAKAPSVSEYRPSGQGFIRVTHFPGFRGVKLSRPIWHDRTGVICNGGLPTAEENLPPYLEKFKTEAAYNYMHGNVGLISVTSDGVQIDLREGKPDVVEYDVYRGIAECLFSVDEELSAVKLEMDSRIPLLRERRYNDQLIWRSSFEWPANHAPAT